jgi:hypothetical protein
MVPQILFENDEVAQSDYGNKTTSAAFNIDGKTILQVKKILFYFM